MVMPMNPEIKARWTAALRSGDYPQTTKYLRTTDGYCCLGVLCDLAVKDGIVTETGPGLEVFGDPTWLYDAEEILLPYAVQQWAGLDTANPPIDPEGFAVTWDGDPDEPGEGYLIANANDGGTTFAVIADIIDAQF